MKIAARLGKSPTFSFEFFPPKDEEGMARLFQTIAELKPYEPAYVSVTYGAGGSTRKLTVELVRRIKREVGIETMAHLTCVGASQGDLGMVLDELVQGGIENVIALRGDPPKGETSFVRHPGGFGYGSELVSFIRSRYDLCVAAACYPETHVDAKDPEADLLHLKTKVEAGVDFLITNLFFENDDYFRFVERARRAGIGVPIVAGIMPITNLGQIKRFTAICGAKIPKELLGRLEAVGDNNDLVRSIGVEHATRQCRELVAQGVPGVHFYTLNRSRATRDILDRLRGAG